MELIAKILSSLKENEKVVIATIIANALIIYLICFLGIDRFRSYIWHQELIISCSLSICYTVTFGFIIMVLAGLFSKNKYNNRIFTYFIESNFLYYLSIFSIGSGVLFELLRCSFKAPYIFKVHNIICSILFVILGLIILGVFNMILYRTTKDTPRN